MDRRVCVFVVSNVALSCWLCEQQSVVLGSILPVEENRYVRHDSEFS